jgi:mRNA interferase MazF
MSQPQRGEVWWVDMGMAGKVRPALVVSAPVGDMDYALLATVPHTTSEHESQFAVRLRVPGMKDGAFNIQGLAAVPLSKFVRRITTLNSESMATIDAAMKRWLCLGGD